jgi:hypothetical protein
MSSFLRNGNYPEDGGICPLTEMQVVFNVDRIRTKMQNRKGTGRSFTI